MEAYYSGAGEILSFGDFVSCCLGGDAGLISVHFYFFSLGIVLLVVTLLLPLIFYFSIVI